MAAMTTADKLTFALVEKALPGGRRTGIYYEVQCPLNRAHQHLQFSEKYGPVCRQGCDTTELAAHIWSKISPSQPNSTHSEETLLPYSVAEYAREKLQVPEDWLRDEWDVQDGRYQNVKCVVIPSPNGARQFRFANGVKRNEAGKERGLYYSGWQSDRLDEPAIARQLTGRELPDYCFITEGASSTQTLAWNGQFVVGSPSSSWKAEYAADPIFKHFQVIYATQDPPHIDPNKGDAGQTFVQKIANSFPDKQVYAIKFWVPKESWDGQSERNIRGFKDVNALWLYTKYAGDIEDASQARRNEFTRLLRGAVDAAELVTPEKPQEWGASRPLNETSLPPVLPFKREYLPESLRPLVQDISERMSCPLDFPAAACVVALAGVVGRRAHVYPKEFDKEWRAPLNLWGAIVAEPSQMKTPVYNAVTKAHIGVQLEWDKQYEEKIKQWDEESEEPKPKRLQIFTNDTTYEALQSRMVDNPQGILYLRDEMMGWIADLEKKGRESDRSFFLTAWGGGYYSVDRIGRGHLGGWVCLSKFGSFQPARLKEFLIKGIEDGLFQREQVLVWPDYKPFKNVDRPANQAALASFARIIALLAPLAEDSIRCDFNAEAQPIFNNWLESLTEKAAVETHAPKVQHLTKYRSLMPILAALFQLADYAAQDKTPSESLPIDAEHARQSIAFCAYLESHLNRVYALVPSAWNDSLLALAQHLKDGNLGEEFTMRELMRKRWHHLTDRDAVEKVLAFLEAKDWLREKHLAPQGGGKTRAWLVNPEVLEEM